MSAWIATTSAPESLSAAAAKLYASDPWQ